MDDIADSIDVSLSKLWEMVKDSLACCSPWGHKKSDTTEQLNNNNNMFSNVRLITDHYPEKKY